jgi:hypothetical protein
MAKNIGFWRFKWLGNQPFSVLFPDLFAKEAVKNAMVCERLQGARVLLGHGQGIGFNIYRM